MSTPWEQLISSTMTPTTAVAVKLAVTDEPPEPTDPNGTGLPPGVSGSGGAGGGSGGGGGIFGALHRHIPILSRLSLNKTADKTPCRSVGVRTSRVTLLFIATRVRITYETVFARTVRLGEFLSNSKFE